MFDCAIIGTSPIGLIEALFRAEAGQKVCLIDQQSKLGGAWVSREQFGIKGVESYCHLIDYDKAGYAALRDIFPGAFYKVRHTPEKYIFRDGSTDLETRYTYASLRGSLQNSPRLFTTLGKPPVCWGWDGVEWLRRHALGRGHIYPIGGAEQLIARLQKALFRSGIEVLLDTTLEKLEMPAEPGNTVQITVRSEGAGRIIDARQIVMTSRTELPSVVIGGVLRSIGTLKQPKKFPHLVMHARVGQESPYSYIDFRGHPIIRRSQNQSQALQLAGLLPRDEEIHIVHLQEEAADTGAPQIIELLRALGLLPETFRVLDAAPNVRVMSLIDLKSLADLRKQTGKYIVLLRTENLSVSLGANWSRWRKLSPNLRF